MTSIIHGSILRVVYHVWKFSKKKLQKKFVALVIIYLPVAAIIVDTRFGKHDSRPEWEGPWEAWGPGLLKIPLPHAFLGPSFFLDPHQHGTLLITLDGPQYIVDKSSKNILAFVRPLPPYANLT